MTYRACLPKIRTLTRRNVWLFDELTEVFSKDIPNPLVTSNESLSASSNPVIEPEFKPETVETTLDAPLTVSLQEKIVLHSMVDHISSSNFPELALAIAVNGSSSSPVLTITRKNLFNHLLFSCYSIQMLHCKCFNENLEDR